MNNSQEDSIEKNYQILFLDHLAIHRIGIVFTATALFGVFLSFAFSTQRYLQKIFHLNPMEIELKDYFNELLKLYHNELSLNIWLAFLISTIFLVFTRDFFYGLAQTFGKKFSIKCGHSHTILGAGDPFDIDYFFSTKIPKIKYISVGFLQTLLSFSAIIILNSFLGSLGLPLIQILLIYISAIGFWFTFYSLRISTRAAIKTNRYKHHLVSAICMDLPIMLLFCYLPLGFAIYLNNK